MLIWLGQVLVESCCFLDLPCFMQDLYLGHGKSCLPHAGSSSLTRDPTQAPCYGSMESWPLDHQGVSRGRVSIYEFGEHTHIQSVHGNKKIPRYCVYGKDSLGSISFLILLRNKNTFPDAALSSHGTSILNWLLIKCYKTTVDMITKDLPDKFHRLCVYQKWQWQQLQTP